MDNELVWITDRDPEKDGKYLVTMRATPNHSYLTFGFFEDGKWRWTTPMAWMKVKPYQPVVCVVDDYEI